MAGNSNFKRADRACAVLALLGVAGVVVLVDGYNVTMTGWPRLSAAEQREALERLVSDPASRGAEVHLVYDGEGGGERRYTAAGSAVRTTFTATRVAAASAGGIAVV